MHSSVYPKPHKIFKRVWPAVILANNRIAKLSTRDPYEIISIKVKNGAITNGVPLGKNKFTILVFCCITPNKLIVINVVDEKIKVNNIWLVKVIL